MSSGGRERDFCVVCVTREIERREESEVKHICEIVSNVSVYRNDDSEFSECERLSPFIALTLFVGVHWFRVQPAEACIN